MRLRRLSALMAALALLLALAGCGGDSATDAFGNSDTAVSELMPEPVPLLYAELAESIALYGPAITAGETKSLQVEIAFGGPTAHFRIERESPNGVRLMGVTADNGQNFLDDIDLPQAFDEYGELLEGWAVQISVLDLNADGQYEVAVLVGDGLTTLQMIVYRYVGGTVPFAVAGVVNGQVAVRFEDGALLVPVGAQGVQARYAYDGQQLAERAEPDPAPDALPGPDPAEAEPPADPAEGEPPPA